jgi:hypothetical protein
MSPRKPPRLATWLLHRLGLARQNPPLTGDLLEEFCSGRSAGWYWRQTVVVILTGLARHARVRRRLLTAYAIGWAAETATTFVLWRLHLPRQFHPSGSEAASVLIFRGFLAVVLIALAGGLFGLLKGISRDIYRIFRGLPANPNMVMIASERFIGLLILYWCFALFSDTSPWDFVFSQSVWLLWEVGFALKDSRSVRS